MPVLREKSGWFSDAHGECVQKAERGAEAVKDVFADAVLSDKKYDDVRAELDKLAADSAIPKIQVLRAIKEGWSRGASQRGIAKPITDQEFSAMSDLYRAAGLTADEMRQTPGFITAVFSFLIWTVLTDQIEPYHGPVSFNLQSGEVPVFGMANVLLSEERFTSTYTGGYSGASIRVANGLYYHLGGVRGHRVQSSSLQEVDYGDFLMTTEGVYFGGTEHGNNFRLPYKQVVRFQPYSDAVGICKNGGKKRIFAPQQVAEAGWFLFNVLQALASKDAERKSHHS